MTISKTIKKDPSPFALRAACERQEGSPTALYRPILQWIEFRTESFCTFAGGGLKIGDNSCQAILAAGSQHLTAHRCQLPAHSMPANRLPAARLDQATRVITYPAP